MNIKKKIIDYFYEIASIPHTSGNTKRIIEYLKRFALQNNLEAKINNENLIITIPATEGLKDQSPIIIQGHIDMVGEKETESNFNFFSDPLDLEISEDEKWLSAKETTLGADDGIAIIYMLLLMTDKTIAHPKIYCVITIDEEIGLIGAKALDIEDIKEAKYIFNLDTEAEGYLTVSSSGGEVITGEYTLDSKPTLGSTYQVSVSNLTGGHSGGNINNYGAQAAQVLAQILGHIINSSPTQLIKFDAKGKNNVITDHAKAEIITTENRDKLINILMQISKVIAPGYFYTDRDIKIELKPLKEADKVLAFTRPSTAKIIFNIMFAPYGVYMKNKDMVLSSSNIGSCFASNNSLKIVEHIRFVDFVQKELIKNKIIQYFTFNGALVTVKNTDPFWKKKENTNLQKYAQETWKEMYGTELNLVDAHATLEAAVFSEKLPEAEILSFGPTVLDIHTPKERLDLDSAERVFNYLVKLIQNLDKVDQ